MKRILSIVIIIIMAVSTGCSRKEQSAPEERVRPVKVMKVEEEVLTKYADYIGVVQYKETKNYSFKAGGKISQIYVKEGQKIKKGDKLAELDKKDMNYSVQAARAQMDGAKAQMDGALSQINGADTNIQAAFAQMNGAKTQVDAALAQVKGAEANIGAVLSQLSGAEAQMNGALAQVSAAEAQYDKVLRGASQEDINKARLNVENAQKAYEYVNGIYMDLKALYDLQNSSPSGGESDSPAETEAAAITKQQLDEAKFNADNAEIQLRQAREILAQVEKGASGEDKRSALANLDAARAQYQGAKAQYDGIKAQYNGVIAQLEGARAQYEGAKTQYEAASAQYEGAKAKYEGAKSESEAAESQYKAAEVQYQANRSMMNDAALLSSDVEGYVLKVLNKPGEMVGAGYPVIVVAADNQIIKTGISQDDIKDVYIGSEAVVRIGDYSGNGRVASIDKTPDTKSRTYNVEIELDEKPYKEGFPLGAIAKVSINMGQRQGIWLPISVIMNDGEDYVYTVQKDRAVRKNVTLSVINEDKVLVEGLSIGDMLVGQGMKSVKPGYKVLTDQ